MQQFGIILGYKSKKLKTRLYFTHTGPKHGTSFRFILSCCLCREGRLADAGHIQYKAIGCPLTDDSFHLPALRKLQLAAADQSLRENFEAFPGSLGNIPEWLTVSFLCVGVRNIRTMGHVFINLEPGVCSSMSVWGGETGRSTV